MAVSSGSVEAPESPGWAAPVAWVGAATIGVLERLGTMALLVPTAFASVFRREDDEERGLRAATAAELAWMLAAGFPLVALVHAAMGSFLSLQAYYGSTFVEGTGAVVGVGLLRNLASMMTGLTLAGFLPVRIIPELRATRRVPRLDEAEGGDESTPSAGRLAAPKLLAAAIATPLLSLWGFSIGTLIGWRASGTLMGLPTSTFFQMFLRMIWFRDVVGLMVKGVGFGFVIALIACAEGLRPDGAETAAESSGVAALGRSMLLATCWAMAAILLMNMTWFILVYHAVPIYGPSLLQPPTP